MMKTGSSGVGATFDRAIINDEEFAAWEGRASTSQKGNPVWRFNAYRVALFILDRAGEDAKRLHQRHAYPFQTDQLLRAVASIGANIAEGLGRQSAAERSQFFGIALGSLRESLTWYSAASSELPRDVVESRSEQLTELRKLLIGSQKWLNSKQKATKLMQGSLPLPLPPLPLPPLPLKLRSTFSYSSLARVLPLALVLALTSALSGTCPLMDPKSSHSSRSTPTDTLPPRA
jgi:four helix bundle protein